MADNKLLEETKVEIRSILITAKNGMSARELQQNYVELIDKPIPYQKCGFTSVEHMLRSIKDCVMVEPYGRDGRGNPCCMYLVKPTKDIAHLEELVSQQKSKPVRGRNGRPMQMRPIVTRAPSGTWRNINTNRPNFPPRMNKPQGAVPDFRRPAAVAPTVPNALRDKIIELCAHHYPQSISCTDFTYEFKKLFGHDASMCSFRTYNDMLQSLNFDIKCTIDNNRLYIAAKNPPANRPGPPRDMRKVTEAFFPEKTAAAQKRPQSPPSLMSIQVKHRNQNDDDYGKRDATSGSMSYQPDQRNYSDNQNRAVPYNRSASHDPRETQSAYGGRNRRNSNSDAHSESSFKSGTRSEHCDRAPVSCQPTIELRHEIQQVLINYSTTGVKLSGFRNAFYNLHNRILNPSEYGFSNVIDMMAYYHDLVRIEKLSDSEQLLSDKSLAAPSKVSEPECGPFQHAPVQPEESFEQYDIDCNSEEFVVVMNLVAILRRHSEGISSQRLMNMYREMHGENIPLEDLGFDRIDAYLDFLIPEFVQVKKGSSGAYTFYATSDVKGAAKRCGITVDELNRHLKERALPVQHIAAPPVQAPLARREIPDDAVVDENFVFAPLVFEYDIEEWIRVAVVNVLNPHNFWLQMVDQRHEGFYPLIDDMMDFYNDEVLSNPYRISKHKLQLGIPCVALYPRKDNPKETNKEWNRCVVISFEGHWVEVYYVDYGSTAHVHIHDIRYITKQYANYPCYAVKAMLANIRPPDEGWSAEATNRFIDLTFDRDVCAMTTIVRDELLGVFITDTTTDPEVCVNDDLLKSGLALGSVTVAKDDSYAQASGGGAVKEYSDDDEMIDDDDDIISEINSCYSTAEELNASRRTTGMSESRPTETSQPKTQSAVESSKKVPLLPQDLDVAYFPDSERDSLKAINDKLYRLDLRKYGESREKFDIEQAKKQISDEIGRRLASSPTFILKKVPVERGLCLNVIWLEGLSTLIPSFELAKLYDTWYGQDFIENALTNYGKNVDSATVYPNHPIFALLVKENVINSSVDMVRLYDVDDVVSEIFHTLPLKIDHVQLVPRILEQVKTQSITGSVGCYTNVPKRIANGVRQLEALLCDSLAF